MKNNFLLLVLVTFFVVPGLYAQQCPCVKNSGMDGSSVGWGSPMGTTLPNWSVVSGNPVMRQGVVVSSGVQLADGDAISTCYDFQKGSTYKVCFRAYTNNGQIGRVRLVADNGIGGSQVIGDKDITQIGLDPADYSLEFTVNPGTNFNQLRIYEDPNSSYTSAVVDDIGAIEIPVVTANPSLIDLCGSTTLTATANAISTGRMNIQWIPPTGLTSPGNKPVVTASPCEDMVYTAIYSSSCPMYTCNTGTIDIPVYVDAGSILNFSDPYCGGIIDLRYSSTTPCVGATYEWTRSKSSNILSTGPNLFMQTSTEAEVDFYKLVIRTQQGCEDSVFVSVKKDCCKVDVNFDIIDCNPIRLVNNTVDANGDPVLQGEWYWDLGDGTTSSLRNPAHLNVMQLTTRTVCLTAVASNSGGTCCDRICKDFDPCDYSACPKAAMDYKVVGPAPDDVQFFEKSAGGGVLMSVEWTITGGGAPQVYNTQHPLVNLGPPLPPGPGVPPGATHYVCLKVVYMLPNGDDCEDTWCEYIQVP